MIKSLQDKKNLSNYLWLNVIYKYVDPRQNDIHGFPGIKGKFYKSEKV